MKVKDIPSDKEFERLKREDPAEFDRLYKESMKTLNRATTRLSTISMIIGLVTILLFLIRVLIKK